jgi:type IV fimbrial biogenesis protein FimT
MKGRGPAGFTLVELMVVVTIISIVAVLAIPSMSHEGYDRRAFTDAANVAEIVREARTRAIARGAAELLVLNANATGNAASFSIYEAVGSAVAGAQGYLVPVSTCNAPTIWPGAAGTATAVLIDAFQIGPGSGLTPTLEGLGNINMRVNDPSTGIDIGTANNLYLCFTPAGRTWYSVGGTPGTFSALASLCPVGGGSCVGAVTVDVTRGAFPSPGTSDSSNLVRTVWIPPSGTTRITSQ